MTHVSLIASQSLELFPFLGPEFFSEQPLPVVESGGGGRILNRLVPNEL